MSDEEDVVRLEVPSSGAGSAAVILGCWLLLGVSWLAGAKFVPGWAGAVLAGGAPLAAAAAVWLMVARRVIVASRDGLRITHRPWSGWDRLIRRADLASLEIVQRDDAGLARHGHLQLEDPSSRWSVSARDAAGAEVPLSDGLRYGDEAEQLVDELRRVLVAPELPVRRTTRRTL